MRMKKSFFQVAAIAAVIGGVLFASLPVSLAHGHWGGGHCGGGYGGGYRGDCPYYNR